MISPLFLIMVSASLTSSQAPWRFLLQNHLGYHCCRFQHCCHSKTRGQTELQRMAPSDEWRLEIADFIVRSIVQFPSCGFNRTDSIVRIGFQHADSIVQILLCGFRCADSIVRFSSCDLSCSLSCGLSCALLCEFYRMNSIVRACVLSLASRHVKYSVALLPVR